MENTLVFDRVWKRFRRGAVHDSLRELIPAFVRKVSGQSRNEELGEKDFWALSDLSFEVKPGEVLGIIGGNGAGKSTTLKILNELMEPTKGRVQIQGKIGSLIEVSAGFHQDLTGRQNVFLQGSIMGMKKAEVTRKFKEIVEFAGVEDFIDTPVKRYSSGMNARLGFSIAAHLEPDVLIIDEVLAVGDYAFQQRAFAKIKKMATGGIPVVLVSHQLDRIAELCTKVILLEKGKVKTRGSAEHCINMYLHPPESESANADAEQHGIRLSDLHAVNGLAIPSGQDISLVLTGESLKASFPYDWQICCNVRSVRTGQEVHSVHCSARGIAMPSSRKFEHHIDLQLNLAPGGYIIETVVYAVESGIVMVKGPRLNIEVLESGRYFGSAQLNLRWKDMAPNARPVAAIETPRDVPIFDEPVAADPIVSEATTR
ncbi:MAG: ABC transporter ATP-binding protein [Gemmatimonas sp.]